MTTGPKITKLPRLFLGSVSLSGEILVLADELRSDGYEVETAGSVVGQQSAAESIRDIVDTVDVAFLVVTKSDQAEASLTSVTQEVGLWQGRLGVDRVVLIVEDGVEGLASDAGIRRIRFAAGKLTSAKSDVVRAVRAAVPIERSLRVPISEQARSSDLRVAWILVGVVLFLTLSSLIMLALRGGSDTPDDVAVPSLVQPTVAGVTAERSSAGLAAATNIPVVCSIDLTSGTLPPVIGCGRGEVVVTGYAGPWHNEVGVIEISPGMTAQVEMESGALTAESTMLELGNPYHRVALDARSSAYGTNSILAEFTTTGQHIHIYQPDQRGGNVATLSFRTL